MGRIAFLVMLSALAAPGFAQQASGPAGLFKAIDDIPTCKTVALSQNLAELAIGGNQAAYKRMLGAHQQQGNCGMLRKGSVVIVRRAVPPGNLVEMMDVNNGVLYGPGMMLDKVERGR